MTPQLATETGPSNAHPGRVRRFAFGPLHRLVYLTLVVLVSPVWGAGPGENQAIAANEPVTFSVTGDVPYGSSEVSLFQEIIDEHDLYSPSELFFHVGDILSGSESCSESRYRTVRDILLSSEVPCYIVPGDNETTDCSNPSQGLQYWMQYLLGLETNWSCSPATSRQSGRQENFAFVHKGILFLGIHLVGGDNSSTLMRDDATWVENQLQQNASQVRGAVVFAQAGPGGNRDTFFDRFETAAAGFGKPMLYVHGDGHSWKKDQPFSASNVTRVQVEQGGQELPVQITATLNGGSSMFEFLRDPWDSRSDPYDRPPCGGSVTPSLAISDVNLDEGDSGTTNAVFTVTLQNPNGQSTSVQFTTRDGSARAGEDYLSDSGTLSFSGSTTSRTISISILGDSNEENDENFYVDLSNPSNASIEDGRGECTIRNDDAGTTPGGTVFEPIADAHIRTRRPDQNYGSLSELRVKTSSTVYRAYLKFQLSNVGTFSAAKLRLYVIDGTSAAGTLHPVSNSYEGTSTPWTEDGITWNNAPQMVQPAVDAMGSVGSGEWVEFDVTAAIQGSGIYSFGLQSESTDSGRYGSRETSNPPQLVLVGGEPGPGPDPDPEPGNTPPVAVDDAYTVAEDGRLSPTAPGVLGNDSDDDADPLTAQVVSQPSHGTVSLQSNGGFTYTPAADYAGSDSFTYRVSDGRGGTDSGNVQIDVTPVPDAPVAVAETYGVSAGGNLDVAAPGVLGNDGDADGDVLSAVLVQDVSHGSLTLRSNGSFTYAPDPGYDGNDSFTYRASDGSLQSSATVVTLNVGGSSSGPLAFVEQITGGSTATASVATSTSFTSSQGDLFLVAVTSKPARTVNSVTGLGLPWSRVRAQCGGRDQTSIEIWMAQGTPGGGSVLATLESSVSNACIAVARYDGADAAVPLGNVVSGNSNGIGGACDGGTDATSFSLPLSTQSGATAFGGVAMRARTLTPGAGWTKRVEIFQGSGGDVASVAFADRESSPGSVTFDGSFNKDVDFAAIAVEIRPAAAVAKASPPAAEPDAWSGLTLERMFPNPMTQAASVAYELQSSSAVEIAIYNVRGQCVRTLTRGMQPAGRHRLRWEADDQGGARVPAGIYFLRATLGSRTLHQKIVVQR